MTQAMMDDIVFFGENTRVVLNDSKLTITAPGVDTELVLENPLGEGGNCKVFQYGGFGLKYAIRICEDDISEGEISEKLNRLEPNYTVKQRLFRTEVHNKDEYTYFYIMECYDMDLNGYLDMYNPNRAKKLDILNDVLGLVRGLKDKGYYYFDLKPDNILCKVSGSNKPRMVLGDIGSLNGGKNKVFISSYPPPESYTNSSNKGYIYLKRFSKDTPAVEQMLSYLMGIMIVALFRSPDDLDMLHFKRMTGKTIPDYKLNVLKSKWKSFENYLNNDPAKRKSIYERMTDKDLPDNDRFITVTSQGSRSPVKTGDIIVFPSTGMVVGIQLKF